jgi:hypothetical protein
VASDKARTYSDKKGLTSIFYIDILLKQAKPFLAWCREFI